MADTNPIELEWRLRTTSDNEGLRQHTEATKLDTAAIQEQKAAMAESSGGYGLATEGQDVYAVETKKAYTVATEAEYVAIQKSLLAAQAKLPVMQALGVSTDKLTLDIAALDAALSTESALNIADTMDANALAAARAREAEATAAAAAAQWQLAGSGMGLRSLHPLLREVTREAGAAAGALSFMFHPGIMGAGFAATMVFMQVKRQIEEVNKVLDESAKLGNAAADWPDKVKKGLLDSLVALDDYERKMSEIGRDLDPIKTKTDEYTTALNEQYKAAESVASAHKKLEEARIEAARLAGTITKDQAIVMKLDLDEKDFERKLNAEVERARKILEATKDERAAEAGAEPGLKTEYETSTRAAAQAEAHKSRFESQLADARDALKKQKEFTDDVKQQEAAQKEEEGLRKLYDFKYPAGVHSPGNPSWRPPSYEDWKSKAIQGGGADGGPMMPSANLQAREQSLAQQAGLRDVIAQKEAAHEKEIEAASIAKDAAKQAADAWAEARKTISQADKEIKKQTTELGILQNENARIINESRQAEWQTKVNKLGEEYEKDFKRSQTKEGAGDQALKAEMLSLKKQFDGLMANKPSLLNVPNAPDVSAPYPTSAQPSAPSKPFSFIETRTPAESEHDKHLAAMGDKNMADYSWGALYEAWKNGHDKTQAQINSLAGKIDAHVASGEAGGHT